MSNAETSSAVPGSEKVGDGDLGTASHRQESTVLGMYGFGMTETVITGFPNPSFKQQLSTRRRTEDLVSSEHQHPDV